MSTDSQIKQKGGSSLKKEDFVAILVLADGETWETVGGQSVCLVSKEQFKDLCDDRIDARDLNPILELAINDVTIGGSGIADG